MWCTSGCTAWLAAHDTAHLTPHSHCLSYFFPALQAKTASNTPKAPVDPVLFRKYLKNPWRPDGLTKYTFEEWAKVSFRSPCRWHQGSPLLLSVVLACVPIPLWLVASMHDTAFSANDFSQRCQCS